MLPGVCRHPFLLFACLLTLISRLRSASRHESYVPWQVIEDAEKDIESSLRSLEIDTIPKTNDLLQPFMDDANEHENMETESLSLHRQRRSPQQLSYGKNEPDKIFTIVDDNILTDEKGDLKELQTLSSGEDSESHELNLNQSSGDGLSETNRSVIVILPNSSTPAENATMEGTMFSETNQHRGVSAQSSYRWNPTESRAREKGEIATQNPIEENENEPTMTHSGETAVSFNTGSDHFSKVYNEFGSRFNPTDGDEILEITDSINMGLNSSKESCALYANKNNVTENEAQNLDFLPTNTNTNYTEGIQSEYNVSTSSVIERKWQGDGKMTTTATPLPNMTTKSVRQPIPSEIGTSLDFDKGAFNPDEVFAITQGLTKKQNGVSKLESDSDVVKASSPQEKSSTLSSGHLRQPYTELTNQPLALEEEESQSNGNAANYSNAPEPAMTSKGSKTSAVSDPLTTFSPGFSPQSPDTTGRPTGESSLNPARVPTGESTLDSTRVPTVESTLDSTRIATGESTLNSTRIATGERTLNSTRGPNGEMFLILTRGPTGERTLNFTRGPTRERTLNFLRGLTGERMLNFTLGPTAERTVNITRGPTGERTARLPKDTTQARSKRRTPNINTIDPKFHQPTFKTFKPVGHQKATKPSTTDTETPNNDDQDEMDTFKVTETAADDDNDDEKSHDPVEPMNVQETVKTFTSPEAKTTTSTTTTTTTKKVLSNYKEACRTGVDCQEPLICKADIRQCLCTSDRWYSKSSGKCRKVKFWQPTLNVSRVMNDTSDGLLLEWSVKKMNDIRQFILHCTSGKTEQHATGYIVPLDKSSSTIWNLELGLMYEVWMEIELNTGAKIPTEKEEILIESMASILNVSTDEATTRHQEFTCSFLIDVSRGCLDSIQAKFHNVHNAGNTITTQLPFVKPACIQGDKRQIPTTAVDLGILHTGSLYDTTFILKRKDEEMTYNFSRTSCPDDPTKLRVIGRGVDWLRFAWKPPVNAYVEDYRVILTRSTELVFDKYVSDPEVTLESLQGNVFYTVKVASRYGCCHSAGEQKRNEKTLEKVPDKPTHLHYQEHGAFPTLSWDKPGKNSWVDFYKVNVNCSMSGQFIRTTNTTFITFQGDEFKPKDCCVFSVWGENDIGKGDEADTTKTPILPDDVNTLATINISRQSSAFRVRRKYSSKADGIIIELHVELLYKRTELSVYQPVYDRVWYCRGYGCVYPCHYQLPVEGESFSSDQLVIDLRLHLQPGTFYRLEVTPKMALGNMVSIKHDFQTPDSAPSSPVRFLKVIEAGMHSAKLTWVEPLLTNGAVVFYNVSLTYEEQLCNESFNGSVPKSSQVRYVSLKPGKEILYGTYKIDGLHPYTNYSLKVTAANSAGQGDQWTNATTFTTARSSNTTQVRHVVQEPQSESIQLQWEEPCPDNGPIDDYHVSVSGVDHNMTFELFTPNTSVLVPNLLPATLYRIHIGSSGQTNMEVKTLTVRTRDGVPGPVEKLTVRQGDGPQEARYIFCQWAKPNQTNGNITVYDVVLTSQPTRTTKKLHGTEVALKVEPETSYTIEVAANTEANTGEFRVVHINVTAWLLPAPKERLSSPLVHQGVACANIDNTRSCVLNLPLTFLCNASYGRILARGVVAVRMEAANLNDNYSPNVAIKSRSYLSLKQPQMTNGQVSLVDYRSHIVPIPNMPCEASSTTSTWNCGSRTTDSFPFLIGENDCNVEQCNKYLNPGSIYKFKAFVCTSAGCTHTLLSNPIKTMVSSDDKSSLILGVVLATIIVVILVLIVAVGYKHRHKLVGFIRGADNSDDPLQMHPRVMPTRPIALSNFVAQVERMHRDSNLLFAEEYKLVTSHSPELSTEMAQNCRKKNRYTNVMPFDHARVKLLPSDDDEQSDYINASFIPGFLGPREYIAAQGPLPCTVDDFWRMIWEQRVSAVVMLTQCIEKGKTKCEQYWPADSSGAAFYGDLHVTLRSESVLADYIIRVMDLELGNVKRTIHQFHFLQWPDFGCPEKPYLLLNLVAAVRDHTPHNRNNPTVVHCSAGVGRTGTYIALDVLLRQMREGNCHEVDIFSLVMKMRQNRPLMVQRENQYIYIFDCLKDAILEESEEENSLTNEEDEALYANCTNSTTN